MSAQATWQALQNQRAGDAHDDWTSTKKNRKTVKSVVEIKSTKGERWKDDHRQTRSWVVTDGVVWCSGNDTSVAQLGP